MTECISAINAKIDVSNSETLTPDGQAYLNALNGNVSFDCVGGTLPEPETDEQIEILEQWRAARNAERERIENVANGGASGW